VARPKKTEAQLEEMREIILDVTEAIIQEEGIEAVSSRTIADKLSISHMSLFTYFENQGAIITAMKDRVAHEIYGNIENISKRIGSESSTLLLKEVWSTILNFANKKPALNRLTWIMPETFSSQSGDELLLSHVVQILQHGMKQGDFVKRDPQLAAITVMGIINMPFVLFYSQKITDATLRDQLVEEGLSAAMTYLKNK